MSTLEKLTKLTPFIVMDIEIDNLICTNCVYISPSEFNKFTCETRYVQLVEFQSGHVFEIVSADFVALGHIALNGHQRKSMQTRTGECVQLRQYRIQPIHVIKLWIKMIGGEKSITILFHEFTTHFQKTYWGHVFCNGQILPVEFDQCFFEVVTYVDRRTTLDESASVKCMFDISNPLLTLGSNVGNDDNDGEDQKTDDDGDDDDDDDNCDDDKYDETRSTVSELMNIGDNSKKLFSISELENDDWDGLSQAVTFI